MIFLVQRMKTLLLFLYFVTVVNGLRLGGIQSVPLADDDERIRTAINEGMHMLNQDRGASRAFLAVEIVEINQQVVSGIKYDVTLRIAPSNCQFDNENKLSSYFVNESCMADPEEEELYQMTVWARPWMEDQPYLLMAAAPAAP
ncbi:unnamed protein product [Heterosigma akashiwo]|mmetsp:Transcript_27506/g.41007  ORF Transcript_27506/g.41007 Transcript_27506/m.41007 type:complete len:144 (-) Transcript_27506:147-578(-)